MKVLLIEDDREIRESLQEGLQQFSYTVQIAEEGSLGLRKALNEQFDVIILDVMLPDISGFEVCTQLRIQGDDTPILMLTARSETKDKVEGLNVGADDYLPKPFEFVELLARLRALTRRQGKVLPHLIQIADLVVDINQMLVTRDGQKIQLAPKEYELLEYLVRNANQVLDKYQILERIWLHETDVAVNTVEVFIGYIRKKVDRAYPESVPLVHTVRGKGYLFGERN